MANAIKTKLQKVSGEYSAKVNDIRDLKEKKKKPFVTDAEVKTINEQIRVLERESKAAMAELNRLIKLEKTAEEYLDLNKKIKEDQAKLAKAEARGEDTVSIKRDINKATSRIGVIAPDVERSFPEIKVAKPQVPTTANDGPTGTPAQAPSTPAVTPGTPAVTPGVVKTPTPGSPKPKPGAPKPKPGEPEPTPAEKKKLTIDEIIDQVAKNYGSIDTIFKTNPDLQALLRKAIGKDGVPNTDDDLTPDQFVKELENTTWFKQNANAVRQRGFYKRQFDDLIKTGSNADELLRTTEYGRGLTYTKQVIADEAKRLGVTVSPDELDLISRDIYDLGYENQPAIVAQRIRAKISYKPGTQLSGVAGENIAELRKVAAANGLDLDKNFGSSLQGWLQNLAQGESIETYKQIIRSAAKLGLPDKVSSLIDQGVDLDTIYNPYRNIMASVLEINPETINLNDKVLRSAIGPDKEMSLYDFQKMLRKDDRWQYTSNAKEEVSGIALGILRDFGFQG